MLNWLKKRAGFSPSPSVGQTAAEAADRLIALGVQAEKEGNLHEACLRYREATATAPGYTVAHLNLGIGLEASGDPAAAAQAYEAALAIDPSDAYVNFNLGKLLHAQGALPRAAQLLEEALRRKPDFPEALVVQSSVNEARGDLEAALASLEAALRLRPAYGGARRNLGLLLARLGRWPDAEHTLRQAAADDADAHYWRGNALVNLERPEEAAACFREALRIRPDFAEPHCYLGSILIDQGRHAEAIGHLTRAITLKPDLADAHVGFGNARVAGRQLEDAALCYRRALELDPRLLQAYVNLGNVLTDLGRPDEALCAFGAALALDPECAEARWSRTISMIPALRESPDELQRSRAAFAAALAELDRWFDARRAERGYRVVGVQQPFWLAYQEENNAELLRSYGQLSARLMQPWQHRRNLSPAAERSAGRIRVGVVSQYFRHHSVWNAIIKGWFQQLDPGRFELSAFCLSTEQDAETAYARSRAARFEHGARPLEQWAGSILAARPDVLIYPEIGMDPMSVKLASLRLAPLQAASWGHPETTGLPTIDCYLSAQGMEPDDAQANYTEELVALPHLGCYVQRSAEQPPAALDDLGIDLPSPLLLCPGTPFKYTPEHDRVFPRIARELGPCRFVFFTYWTQALSCKLRQRLERAFESEGLEFGRYVTFLPWLTRTAFAGLMQRADVFLDTIGFSGFNTALQAIQCGLPVVTLQGRFLRGRLATGILRRMGLDELVAQDEDAYVALAARLGRDAAYRAQVRRRIEARRHVLYEDVAPIRALEEFLARAVG
jgi:predicted O-linked N-acetylglucosamine transferase (SPINDLY family)